VSGFVGTPYFDDAIDVDCRNVAIRSLTGGEKRTCDARSKVNAVRAAFKGWNHALTDCATVWISQSNVRRALASDKPKP